MHIPNEMLNGTICPVTAAVSALGIGLAAFFAFRSKSKPPAAKFAAVTALIFAGQMMNFPISDGTSGHLLGGVIASSLLGIPFGVLSMALVVTIQCLVFADGGFTVLGANILNMALIGAGLGGFIHAFLDQKRESILNVGIAAWCAVMGAALACSIELALSGTIGFSQVAGAMLSTHAVIGIGEGLITFAVCAVLASKTVTVSSRRSVTVPLIASGIIATMLSPFASGFPDGLEWVASKYSFLHDAAPTFVSPLPDYSVTAIANEGLSTGLAGLIGVIVIFSIAWVFAKGLSGSHAVRAD